MRVTDGWTDSIDIDIDDGIVIARYKEAIPMQAVMCDMTHPKIFFDLVSCCFYPLVNFYFWTHTWQKNCVESSLRHFIAIKLPRHHIITSLYRHQRHASHGLMMMRDMTYEMQKPIIMHKNAIQAWIEHC